MNTTHPADSLIAPGSCEALFALQNAAGRARDTTPRGVHSSLALNCGRSHAVIEEFFSRRNATVPGCWSINAATQYAMRSHLHSRQDQVMSGYKQALRLLKGHAGEHHNPQGAAEGLNQEAF